MTTNAEPDAVKGEDDDTRPILRPCPFCGSAHVVRRITDFGERWIQCRGCFASSVTCTTTDQAIKAWNARAEPAAPAAQAGPLPGVGPRSAPEGIADAEIEREVYDLNAHWCRYGFDTITFHKFIGRLDARLTAAEAATAEAIREAADAEALAHDRDLAEQKIRRNIVERTGLNARLVQSLPLDSVVSMALTKLAGQSDAALRDLSSARGSLAAAAPITPEGMADNGACRSCGAAPGVRHGEACPELHTRRDGTPG